MFPCNIGPLFLNALKEPHNEGDVARQWRCSEIHYKISKPCHCKGSLEDVAEKSFGRKTLQRNLLALFGKMDVIKCRNTNLLAGGNLSQQIKKTKDLELLKKIIGLIFELEMPFWD